MLKPVCIVLTFVGMVFVNDYACAQVEADFTMGGGIKIGPSDSICDTSLEGSLRWNAIDKTIDVCDGTEWGRIAAENGASSDPTPDAFTFTDVTDQTLGALVVSDILTITGFDGPLIAEVSGGGTPELQINSGAWVTAASINPGDTIRVRLITSVSVNTLLTATVTIGTVSDNWQVTTRAGQLKMFRTTNRYFGHALGGLSGADAICQSDAAVRGYAGVYVAFLSDETTNLKDRITIQYPITRPDGTVIDASSLWDGSLQSSLVFHCGCGACCTSGNTGHYWTGTDTAGVKITGDTCDSWSSNIATGSAGESYATSTRWISEESNSACTNTRYLMCIQQ